MGALTTATSVVSAQPDGKLLLYSNLLPVRVRHGSGWAPVSTTLVKAAGGWQPAMIPGDSVVFSPGGRARW